MTDTAALVEVAARAICGVNEPDPDADMLPGTPCWVALIPEAQAVIDALHVREMRAALEECQDKLWVIHFNLPDASEREAALNACNMATKALALFTPQPEASDDPA